MKHRLVPVLVVVLIFAVGLGVGRLVILPMLHARATASAQNTPAAIPSSAAMRMQATQTVRGDQPPFDECLQEALQRRMDPIEARHTCNVIAGSI